MEITKEYVEPFNIYSHKNSKYTFFHIDIENKDVFHSNLFDYFFEKEKLIQYIKNQKGITFEPSDEQYATLYKHLSNYIDNEKLEAQCDKIGKIGEYFFHIILSIFFKFDCIIPKVHYTTNKNMPVHGMDVLFYSSQDNLLLFGEAKFHVSLKNGIKSVNESLKGYEKRIEDEFSLVLSGGFKDLFNPIFKEKFGTAVATSTSVTKFIEKANIKNIGIPIFIAHGTEINKEDILKKLDNIKKCSFFNIDTTYLYISLPVINKKELMRVFTEKIRELKGLFE